LIGGLDELVAPVFWIGAVGLALLVPLLALSPRPMLRIPNGSLALIGVLVLVGVLAFRYATFFSAIAFVSWPVPTPLEYDEARARWRELAREDVGLGPIAAFHDERLAALVAAPPPDIALDLTPEAATDAIAAGRSLLGEGALTCETEDVSAELKRLA